MATPHNTVSQLAPNAGRGVLMGAADVIPGVSGGTVALVLGIYERLIASISAFVRAATAIPRGDTERARLHFGAVEWTLVLPLAAGIGVALGAGSVLLPPLLERFPSQTNALFLGLVAGSLPVPWRRIPDHRLWEFAAVAVAAVAAFWLVGLPPRVVEDPGAPQVFGAAALAISAMILPGVSGAFLLKAMGLYEVSLSALRHLDPGYLAPFAAGAAIGLAVFSRLLGWLLVRAHDLTMAVLVGLMAGALRALWPWQGPERQILAPPADAAEVAIVAVLALLGLAAVLALTKWGERTREPVELDAASAEGGERLQ